MFASDEAKRRTNLRKHGIHFAEAANVFREFTLTAEDNREAWGEQRFLILGQLEHQVVSVRHTERDDQIRTISIRKATKHEARFYFTQIFDQPVQGPKNN